MTTQPREGKPRHLGPDYASQWQDEAMARAYVRRPPYPDETFEILTSLIAESATAAVLDVGAGTGDLARPLAACVERVDAVEPSAAMIDVGRQQEHGRAANLRWLEAPIEAAELAPPYGLAVAGESIHWTNWDAAFRRIATALAPGAVFAIVERHEGPLPWSEALVRLITRYSTNDDYAPFDLIAGLEARGYFEILGRARTDDCEFTQSREALIEAMHSRNGFSRGRMGVSARVFDAAYRDLLMRHGVGETVQLTTWAEIVWGRPRP